ncbi:MAG TPA: hypothetical protein VK553_03930 [Candidatus Nitrosopolaris rasttigaisensis]|nr:hypothetical protein [Candidatus Nitrosopolaris rasttigaisensis]
MIIDLSGLQTYFTVGLSISAVCGILTLFHILRVRTAVENLSFDIETLTSKTLDLTKKLGMAEGQMQGRDWATQQTTTTVNDVINVAGTKALEIVNDAHLKATLMVEKALDIATGLADTANQAAIIVSDTANVAAEKILSAAEEASSKLKDG